MAANTLRAPRARLRLVAAAAVALATAACGGSSLSGGGGTSGGAAGGGGGDSVKIGLVVPLSGVYAPLGEDMKNGFQLYLDQHANKLGGKTVNLVTADEGEGPQTGVPAVTRVVTQERVAAVTGIVNSATALGVKDTVVSAKVPLVISNAGADGITASGASPYIWRTSFTNGTVGAPLGEEVAKRVGGGTVYLMAPDYAAGKEQIAGFRKTFEAAGGKVAGEAYTPFGTTQDFQPFLSRVRSSGADAVFVFYAGAEAVNFVKQYAQFNAGGKTPLFGTGFLTEGGVLAAQGAAAQGVETSLHYSNSIDSPRNKEFAAAYRDKFKEEPTTYAVQSYDAATVLDSAIGKGGATTGEAIGGALGQVGTVDSPRGPWSFDDKHDPKQPYYLRKVDQQGSAYANTVVRQLTAAR